MTFSEKIKALRVQKGLKQKDVAQMIGVSDRVYSYYEDGRFPKDTQVLTKLAHVLDTSVSYLVGDSEQDNLIPPEVVMIARKTASLSDEQRQKVYRMLDDTIDQVLALLEDGE